MWYSGRLEMACTTQLLAVPKETMILSLMIMGLKRTKVIYKVIIVLTTYNRVQLGYV